MHYSDERGFTLIESLLHCIIFVVVTFGFALLLSVNYKIPSTSEVLEEVAWEVASYDVNRLLLLDVNKIYQSKNIIYVEERDAIKYSVVLSSNNLYKSKNGGVEPLLMTLQKGKWEIEDNYVLLKATLKSGEMKERAFYVPHLVQ